MTSRAALSVIVPAYRSAATIAGCLAALGRQSFEGAETIVVDSSPDEATADIVRRFPSVHLERTVQRLLPQAARNQGAAIARGELFVFTDPDVYPAADWLERLVAAYHQTGAIVVGAIACFGRRWLDTGAHLCKFSSWLPAGPPRSTDMSPTANMLIARATFASLGGFPGDVFQGDAVLAWHALSSGRRIWFEPRAVVRHHHLTSVRAFVGERFRRGRDLGFLRAAHWGHSNARDALFAVVSLLPIRLVRVAALTVGRSWRAGTLLDLFRTAPVVLLGHEAWLLGEGLAFARDLFGRPKVGVDDITFTPKPGS